MSESIFRKKSLERISSPEQLNDYIRVSNPGVWLLLLAAAALLIGACVWGFFGRMDTKLETAVLVHGEAAVCYLTEERAGAVSAGMPVSVGGAEYSVRSVSTVPVQLPADTDTYYLYLSGLAVGDWVRVVTLDAQLPDGVHPAQIIVDRVAPLYFALN